MQLAGLFKNSTGCDFATGGVEKCYDDTTAFFTGRSGCFGQLRPKKP